jgi:hypothetical protein
MAFASQPRDQHGAPIPVLSPTPGGTVKIAIAGTSARVALPANTDIVRLCADSACFVRFGTDNTVVATVADMLFLPGAEVFEVPAGCTYIAAIQSAAAGTLTITQLA